MAAISRHQEPLIAHSLLAETRLETRLELAAIASSKHIPTPHRVIRPEWRQRLSLGHRSYESSKIGKGGKIGHLTFNEHIPEREGNHLGRWSLLIAAQGINPPSVCRQLASDGRTAGAKTRRAKAC